MNSRTVKTHLQQGKNRTSVSSDWERGVGVFRKEASTFWGDSNVLHLERSQGYTGAVLVKCYITCSCQLALSVCPFVFPFLNWW